MTLFDFWRLENAAGGHHDFIAPMIDMELLKQYSCAHGISGHEDEVRRLFVSDMPKGSVTPDGTGSLVCTHGSKGPRVMLAAHMDEIGFIVQNILPGGFISVVPVGGWWSHTLLSQRVEIKTRTGRKILGVIGSKPPHFLPEQERRLVMPMEAVFIDVGAVSREQAVQQFGISLGDPVAPAVPFTVMANSGRVMGKAFDNRAGMAALVAATKILHAQGHPNILLSTATAQEEVGTRGAKTIAATANPDCAIILEAPPADDTPGFPPSEAQGALGKGVQIRLYDPTAITNPALARLTEEAARENRIDYQLTVRRTGGTDAGAIHVSQRGIPCIVLGIPTRYIHAHNGMLDLKDYQSAIQLAVALVKKLDADHVSQLTRYL